MEHAIEILNNKMNEYVIAMEDVDIDDPKLHELNANIYELREAREKLIQILTKDVLI